MNTTEKPVPARRFLSTKELTVIGLMTAVTCILAPIAFPLPFSPVPLSFGSLAVCLAAYVLGMKKGFISYLVYFLLGMGGVPVFAGFTGGMDKVAGPTGGYLIGFFFLALIVGFFADCWPNKKAVVILGMILGNLACYLVGTIWLAKSLDVTFIDGLGIGVLPYLPGDIAKGAAVAMLGPVLRKAVNHL